MSLMALHDFLWIPFFSTLVRKCERKNDQKLLDTIKEFADNLNKYVDQHNSAQKLNNNIVDLILSGNHAHDSDLILL